MITIIDLNHNRMYGSCKKKELEKQFSSIKEMIGNEQWSFNMDLWEMRKNNKEFVSGSIRYEHKAAWTYAWFSEGLNRMEKYKLINIFTVGLIVGLIFGLISTGFLMELI